MSTYGFFGDHNNEEGWDCRHKPYLIPAIEGIPPRFWNTSDWEQLGEQGLLAIGVDPEKHQKTLKEMLAIQMEHTTIKNYSVVNLICLHYHHLWIDRPDIRQSLKDGKHMSSALIRHLIHVEDVEIPTHLQRYKSFTWQPIDTLRVCTPKSVHYRYAMELFLTSGKNNKQIAQQLALNGHGVEVKLPKALRKQGFTEWNENAVATLKQLMQVRDIDPEILLVERLSQIIEHHEYTRDEDLFIRNLVSKFRRDQYLTHLAHTCISSSSLPLITHHPACLMRYLLDKYHTCLPEKVQGKITGWFLARTQVTASDKLLILKPGTKKWKKALLAVAENYLKEGRGLTYICSKLQNGGKFTSQPKLRPVDTPMSEESSESCSWNNKLLLTLLNEAGATPSDLIAHNPQAAKILKQEYRALGVLV